MFFVPYTVKSYDITIHVQEKKMKKVENAKCGRHI